MNYKLGMIGLGTMGRNLLLNMADHGFAVAGYDKDPEKVSALNATGDSTNVKGFADLNEFIQALSVPRAIMLLVPAGKIVDNVIDSLIPLLSPGDLVIDGGNSHFTDTDRRVIKLQEHKLHFFGMGISGGEEGARRGPSLMPGGDPNAYEVVKPVLEAVAARVNEEPCVTYLGPGSAGHFVKMVHNGIEYAIMQLLAETYGIMKSGMSLSGDRIHTVFQKWSVGPLESFLVEITRDIFAFKEPGSSHLLLEDISDVARSKGTGKWTSQIAMDLQVSIPTIDTAVSMRDLSKYKALRTAASEEYPQKRSALPNGDKAVDDLEQAFYFNMILCYAQGLHLLAQASKEYKYDLKLGDIAKIWRGGCIIRSRFLEDIFAAFNTNADLEHLILDPGVKAILDKAAPCTRAVVESTIGAGIAAPAYAATLSYFDMIRTAHMPTNLIQAQRDFFGAHTYERIGKEGTFHTEWTTA